MDEPLIRTRNLTKTFPMGREQVVALDRVSLSFARGEFAGLVGPSGSGKTTFLNIVGTLDLPSSGEASLLGRSLASLHHKEAALLRNQHIGFIFQTFNLLPVYTVFENVAFPLLLQKVPAKEREQAVNQALDWVGLTEKARVRPDRLSGGQCQRVAIARAMVKRPELVLADEPTANLDAENSHHILQTMVTLNEELGTTFLFSTHDEKVIGYLRRKIVLVDGSVAEDLRMEPAGAPS
jgi:putative ABC transport system ATP-binding protein